MDGDLRQHGDVRRTSEPRGDDDSVMPAPPSQHEVDVVALERASGVPDHLLMLGEAKWRADAVGVGEMERLCHIRELVGTPAGQPVWSSSLGRGSPTSSSRRPRAARTSSSSTSSVCTQAARGPCSGPLERDLCAPSAVVVTPHETFLEKVVKVADAVSSFRTPSGAEEAGKALELLGVLWP